jgi:pimeloyl-ACP methyl ester carboxylesterase
MFYNAKNGKVKIGNTDMDYISFGKGEKNLIMIPGLGDGLKTVHGSAVTMAVMYRHYAKMYKVYVFSRKNLMEERYTTREMAKDQVSAMEKLGITKADVLGVSQGGMIAQFIAIDYPEFVEKLVLAVGIIKTK